MTSMSRRKKAPTATTSRDDAQAYRCWAYSETWGEWECMAAFAFLRDCLDYIAGLQDGGVDCVFQSPAHTDPVKATDARVVWKPEQPGSVPRLACAV